MSDTTKKIAMVVVVVVALGIAIFSITRTIVAEQPVNAGPLGGGTVDPSNPGAKRSMQDSGN